MNPFAFKKTSLATAFALVLAVTLTSPANAALLRSSNGNPVLATDGGCVVTGNEGAQECEGAKAVAGMTDTTSLAEKTVMTAQKESVYFDFNQAVLTNDAKQVLDALALRLGTPMADQKKNGENGHAQGYHHHHILCVRTLTVTGYADRIGNADYNEKLALKRAEAVRAYLIGKGIKVQHINIRTLGKTVPTADCSADLSRGKLISCLSEDRRVVIEYN